jgi:hypothetical protein
VSPPPAAGHRDHVSVGADPHRERFVVQRPDDLRLDRVDRVDPLLALDEPQHIVPRRIEQIDLVISYDFLEEIVYDTSFVDPAAIRYEEPLLDA